MSDKITYFFVRGFMRSGTNWIGNLLNLHPDICCNGEYHLHRLYEGLDRITNPKRDPCSIFMSQDIRLAAIVEFERFAKRMIELGATQLDKSNATILGARTPCLLNRKVIRNARRIHLVRDGRDCLVSLTFHFLNLTGTRYPFEEFPLMQEKRALFQEDPEYFVNNPEKLLDDESWVRSRAKNWRHRVTLDQKFIARHQDIVYSTTYEKTHADTETVRNEIYRFLGADPAKAAPLTNKTSAGFKKENVLSHYRKGSIGDWKKYFTPQTCQWFLRDAGEALKATGYESDDSWIHQISG